MGKKVALFSVLKKDDPDINPIAATLIKMGWDIFGSKGTKDYLEAGDLPAHDVAELTGQGPILRHMVVTLAQSIHAGLLASTPEDLAELEQLDYKQIDLVYVGLYDLLKAILDPNRTDESVNKATDMGGVALLSSGWKGGRIVICDPADWPIVLQRLKENGNVDVVTRRRLIAKAYFAIAQYRMLSARYFSDGSFEGIFGEKVCDTLYGENAWQTPASLFRLVGEEPDPLGLPQFICVQGVDPSFNNYVDVERLMQTMTHVVVGWQQNYQVVPDVALAVKHGNACGLKVRVGDRRSVIEGAVMGDAKAVFGGLAMFNFAIGVEEAELILTFGMPLGKRRLLDGIIAPSFTPEAVEMLKRKKDKCRLLANPALAELTLDTARRFRYVRDGWLQQPNYIFVLDFNHPELKVYGQRDLEIEHDLLIAWAIGSTQNSNTITIVGDGELKGNGVSQQLRVGAGELAVSKARSAVKSTDGAVAYSDSFFPFVDGPAVLIAAGIRAIFSTSGSVADKQVQAICQAAGVTLYQLPDKIARGFFGH